MRVLDPHHAALDANNAVALVAELEDIAGHALDREILVDRADDVIFRLQRHLIIGIVWNRAAGGQCREPCASSAAQYAIDAVVMDERPAPAATGAEPLGEHLDNRREILAWQAPIRP